MFHAEFRSCKRSLKQNQGGGNLKKKEKTRKSFTIEDIGYIYTDFFRGQDVWGLWHEEDYYCFIETKTKHIDLGERIGMECEGIPTCANRARGYECPESDIEECPSRDEKGICAPELLRFRITVQIETEPVNDPKIIEQWNEETTELTPTGPIIEQKQPLELFLEFQEELRDKLVLPSEELAMINELIETCQAKHLHFGTPPAVVLASCAHIVTSYGKNDIKKRNIAEVLQINPEQIDPYCSIVCSSLSLPPIASPDEKLKKIALKLRKLVKEKRSFYEISEKLEIEPKILRKYLRKLKLRPYKVGWNH